MPIEFSKLKDANTVGIEHRRAFVRTLTGADIVRLMRRHHRTLRGIKADHGITLKRVREVRAQGVTGFMAEDWFRIITGRWPEQGELCVLAW
ncbi:MAG: hypothetical protein JF606_15190 [Burkholderiales bacterium]|jgi:hypothetical protein|nr:hypothetical protein [Burkholderiales bacterium]